MTLSQGDMVKYTVSENTLKEFSEKKRDREEAERREEESQGSSQDRLISSPTFVSPSRAPPQAQGSQWMFAGGRLSNR